MTAKPRGVPKAARRALELVASRLHGGPPCAACGFRGRPLPQEVLGGELVAQWELDPRWARWMEEREGSRCARCGANLRSMQLAGVVVREVNRAAGTSARHLKVAFRDERARALSIAEINRAGNLHRHLARCPGLRFSEYGSRDPAVPSEDLTRLSYPDSSFDLVVTSDTLEHVPDVEAALREVLRVLKPGAAHVFTTPVVWDRATRPRAAVRDGKVVHLLPPSYHGAPGVGAADLLVFHEFGGDLVARIAKAGYEVEVVRSEANPALAVLVTRRPA